MTADVYARMHEVLRGESASICFAWSNASRSQPTRRELSPTGERQEALEPIAARATGDPLTCKPMHDLELLHFIGRSPWSDRLVRREAAWYAVEALREQEPVSDVDHRRHGIFVKPGGPLGRRSKRQYTRLRRQGHQLSDRRQLQRRYAKRGNVPIDFALYLPGSRGPMIAVPDVVRRRASRTTVAFKTKLDPRRSSSLPPPSKTRFRAKSCLPIAFTASSSGPSECHPHLCGFDFGVKPSTQSPGCGCSTRSAVGEGEPVGAQQLGVDLGPKAFRRITWREGTKGTRKKLSSSSRSGCPVA